MMTKQEIQNWLRKLPACAEVYLDEGGLTLRSGDAMLEVGGEPEQEDRVVPDRNPNMYSPLYMFRCPKCGQYGRFEIAAETLLEVTDEGSEDIGDHEWSQDSFCRCPECEWQGKVGEASGS
jgi:hypothetical protein